MTEGTEVRETSRWATPVLLAIFGFYMFMWGIPAIGHRILLADDYYGMARSPYFDYQSQHSPFLVLLYNPSDGRHEE